MGTASKALGQNWATHLETVLPSDSAMAWVCSQPIKLDPAPPFSYNRHNSDQRASHGLRVLGKALQCLPMHTQAMNSTHDEYTARSQGEEQRMRTKVIRSYSQHFPQNLMDMSSLYKRDPSVHSSGSLNKASTDSS